MSTNINSDGSASPLKPGIPSIETRLLATYMESCEADILTYADLSGVINQNIQGKARGYLLAARRIVRREKQMIFRPIRDVGLRRLTQSEVTKLEDRFRHIRRTAKEALRELETVDLAKVSDGDRMACIGKMTLATFTAHTHGDKQLKRIQESILSPKPLDLTATLELFKGSV